jgi:HAD superfamily phosphatase
MEDAPGKPDPSGLFMAVTQLGLQHGNIDTLPIIYVGDTVADMQTIAKARIVQPERVFVAVGVLPPHILAAADQVNSYRQSLIRSGAKVVINNVKELTPELIHLL